MRMPWDSSPAGPSRKRAHASVVRAGTPGGRRAGSLLVLLVVAVAIVAGVEVACGSSGAGGTSGPDGSVQGDDGGPPIGEAGLGSFDCAASAQQLATTLATELGCVDGGSSVITPACLQAAVLANCSYLAYEYSLANPQAYAVLESRCAYLVAGENICAYVNDVDAQAAAAACESQALSQVPLSSADIDLKARFCAFCPDGDAGDAGPCTSFFAQNGAEALIFSDSVVAELAQQCTPPAGWEAGLVSCANAYSTCVSGVIEYLYVDAAPPFVLPPGCIDAGASGSTGD
jgi:hypothetical protein